MKHLVYLTLLLCSTFSFSQESWMRYPRISPDGSNIAFCYQGDIFVVPAAGGNAQQLTTNSAYDGSPVWSNDGKTIAFSSDRYGNFDVFTIPSTGGTPTRLTFNSSSDFPQAFRPNDQEIIFTSRRLDNASSIQFPTGILGEIYSVPVKGGREKMLLSVAAQNISMSNDGKKMIFQDVKGYENTWRKHQQASSSRDIVQYDIEKNEFKQLTNWIGEDRNPVFIDDNSFYFLSEKSGNSNIWKGAINGESYEEQLTDFASHPVRFLTISTNKTLCFGYHGDIYTLVKGGKPTKIPVTIHNDATSNATQIIPVTGNASEFSVSADNKEIAFVFRGDVFVTSVDYTRTKRITNTPQQERDVSFSPDGKKVIYASERSQSWDIFETERVNSAEKYFYNATLLKETPLIQDAAESFSPKYSPNGEEIAFLENRTAVYVFNLKTKQKRCVLPSEYNYSYADGDQYFTWSPDSKYLLVNFFDNNRWSTNIGLLDVSGKAKPINLTQSGYSCSSPKFAMNGEMVYYATDKYGMRSHGSWGSQSDVEAVFLTKDAYYKFTLSETDYKIWKEEEEESKKKAEEKATKDKDKDKKSVKKSVDKADTTKSLAIDVDGLFDRKLKLTINSSFLADVIINNDATEMYYLSSVENGFDLWSTKFKENETKLISKLGNDGSVLYFDKEEKSIFFNNKGTITKFELASSVTKPISISSELNLNASAERDYMFEHAWRQAREKFYVKDMHGVDWDFYKREYAKKLPLITEPLDFSELLSELLGELNASHTGSGYRHYKEGDQTATFGCYFDESFTGNGLKIKEIMEKSPLNLHSKKIKNGVIIEKIDGELIEKETNYFPLLNRKIGKKILVSFFNDQTAERWDEIITPISQYEENQLAYHRWIKRCEHIVDSVSNGTIGYVHVEGMDSESFREVYSKVLGKLNTRKALIVDTRFNGGGWLHDDLATFLSGSLYMQFEPRGQKNMGGDPLNKWQKPSCVLMSEGNYSDAHLFPYTYKALGIGPLIGMPVPGTGTAVWWETMIDGHTYFGIPQLGMRGIKDDFLVENHELQPDFKVNNEYNQFLSGVDQQLMKAIEEMMKK